MHPLSLSTSDLSERPGPLSRAFIDGVLFIDSVMIVLVLVTGCLAVGYALDAVIRYFTTYGFPTDRRPQYADPIDEWVNDRYALEANSIVTGKQ